MACCLTAPSHYPNQCQHITKDFLCHSVQSNLTGSTCTHKLNPKCKFEDYTFKFTDTSPRGQWRINFVQYCEFASLWWLKINSKVPLISQTQHTSALADEKKAPSKNMPKVGPEVAPVKLSDACSTWPLIFFAIYAIIIATPPYSTTRIRNKEHLMSRRLNYRKISNIRHTKFQHLNVSHLVLQLSLPNSLKPDVNQIMKM